MGPSVGETICGRIRIEAEAAPSLGATAFGVVRRATLVDTSEELWLTVVERKLVPSHVDLSRFMAGANALLGLRHPTLVRVDLVDREADYCVIGFEALPGARPLTDLIETNSAGPLLDRAAVEVARGLAHLHRAGRMHGALGPGAVLVWEGVPMLWQYGLAELCDGERFAAQTRRLGGDLVAPEIRRAALLEPRADVYAWGALMAELVVGARGAEAVTAVLEGDADPRNEHAELLGVVRTALDPDPERRPLDAVALLKGLQETGTLAPAGGRVRQQGVGELARRYLAELAAPIAHDGDPLSGLDASIPITTSLDGPDPIAFRDDTDDELDAAFGPPIGEPLEAPAPFPMGVEPSGLPPLRRTPSVLPLHASASDPATATRPPAPRRQDPPRASTRRPEPELALEPRPSESGAAVPIERGLTVPVRRHATLLAPTPPPPISPASLLPPRRRRNVGGLIAIVGSAVLALGLVVGLVVTLRAAEERGGLSVLLGLRPSDDPSPIAEASAQGPPRDGVSPPPAALYECPADMAPLEGDPRTCIDRGEFPGLREIPRIQVTQAEARAACVERGRRLCTTAEWRTACAGPHDERRFPYGSEHRQDACNEATATGKGQNLSRGGARDDCRTATGVFDLAGNVAEWVEEGTALGGDATTPAANCLTRVKLGPAAISPSLGFRCCATLAE